MKNIVLQKTILETGSFGGGWGFTGLETVTRTVCTTTHYTGKENALNIQLSHKEGSGIIQETAKITV